MSQSGAVPPVHSRRHQMNQNNATEPIPAARFGETEWEARDVRIEFSDIEVHTVWLLQLQNQLICLPVHFFFLNFSIESN